MNLLDKARQERLEKTEASLKLAGAVKCKVCNYWVSNSYIEAGVCNECITKKGV